MATVTLFKVHCAHCGEITPQLDNTCTWLCQVCSGHNDLFNLQCGEWTAEELAAYWQMKYRALSSQPAYATFIAHTGVVPAVYGGVCRGATDTPGTVLIADPIPGGMMVSPVEQVKRRYVSLEEEQAFMHLQEDLIRSVHEQLSRVAIGVPVVIDYNGIRATYRRNSSGMIDVEMRCSGENDIPSVDPNTLGTL